MSNIQNITPSPSDVPRYKCKMPNGCSLYSPNVHSHLTHCIKGLKTAISSINTELVAKGLLSLEQQAQHLQQAHTAQAAIIKGFEISLKEAEDFHIKQQGIIDSKNQQIADLQSELLKYQTKQEGTE